MRNYRITRVLLLVCAGTAAVPAQRLATIYAFCSTSECISGAVPSAALAQGLDGNLYGTTYDFGADEGGTVFRITPCGKLTTLHSLDPATEGEYLYAGLTLGTNGLFYGTTSDGGPGGATGTVFRITEEGKLTTLYAFSDGAINGDAPMAGLVQGMDGNFYGTTQGGGINGWGTVFKMTPAGELTTLYSFCAQSGCTDGAYPEGQLIQGTDGNLYGTTLYGGVQGQGICGSPLNTSGCGTIFKLTLQGVLTNLYTFCAQDGCADGALPYAGLIQGTDGNLYGTTYEYGSGEYGTGAGGGTVFTVTTSGVLTTLYNFCSQSGCSDGAYPFSGLIQASDGNFYGTTTEGGIFNACGYAYGCGTVFRITPRGGLTSLYSFCSQTECGDGFQPVGGLVQYTDGNLYGTTALGGPNNNDGGTIFGMNVGLGPFVRTVPTSARVGTSVQILGNSLSGATGVSFGGTPAAFTVNSSGTAILATVPAGATTGTVQVVTPNGRLSSDVLFRILWVGSR
jgi:uncharacterized repeat protein (TIGR03803 family)